MTFGTAITTFGDNPFAMCVLSALHQTAVTEFNGKKYEEKNYSYTINDNVQVYDGGLYFRVPNGWEMVVYTGVESTPVVMEDTVRVGAMAFTGAAVQMVTLPYTVAAVGHKAFYECENLSTVVFQSYNAPILEEAYDPAYYESYEHIPGTGDYGTYTDYEGNEVSIVGAGIIPYFIWNATGGMYSNMFYGANFVDYVGYVGEKLTMVRPVNGVGYENYIFNHYFDLRIMGAAAADLVTIAAINAIKQIPERVTLTHRALVEAARAAYNKIATLEQQSLVSNYDVLLTAEQRIKALSATEEEDNGSSDEDSCEKKEPVNLTWLWILLIFLANDALLLWGIWAYKKGYFTKAYLKDFFKKLPGRTARFFKKLPGRVARFFKKLPGRTVRFFKKLPGRLVKAGKVVAAFFVKVGKAIACGAKALWAAILALVVLIAAKCKKNAPAAAEETPAEEISTEETPAEEIPAPVAAEIPAETPAVAEEIPAEEAPVAEETPIVEETPAEKPAPKAKKPFNKDLLKLIAWIAAGAVALGGLVWLLASMDMGGNDPYKEYDAKGYTVAIKFDANGGQFGDNVNTTSVVDTFNPTELAAGSDVAQIALLDPSDSRRGANNSFTVKRAKYVLAGWYAMDAQGNPYKQWNFDSDRVPVPVNGNYTSADPVLTLYAVWVPLFEVEFYDIKNPSEPLKVKEFNPNDGIDLTIPTWDESTGKMNMHQFPSVSGKTFNKVYYDAAGQKPVEGDKAVHPGKVNAANGTAEDAVLKLYVDYTEGEWYHIYSAEQLAKNINLNGHYVLYADLDFSNVSWPAAFTSGNFAGSIVGNGHTIKNVTVLQKNFQKPSCGLFGGVTSAATMSDVTFENITLTLESGTRVTDAAFGLFAGNLAQDASLTNVTVKGKLQIDSAAKTTLKSDCPVGLLCGVGENAGVTYDVTYEAVGEAADSVEITEKDGQLEIQFN